MKGNWTAIFVVLRLAAILVLITLFVVGVLDFVHAFIWLLLIMVDLQASTVQRLRDKVDALTKESLANRKYSVGANDRTGLLEIRGEKRESGQDEGWLF